MKESACDAHDSVELYSHAAFGLNEHQGIKSKISMPRQPVSGRTNSLSNGYKVGLGFSGLRRYHVRDVNSGTCVHCSRCRIQVLMRYLPSLRVVPSGKRQSWTSVLSAGPGPPPSAQTPDRLRFSPPSPLSLRLRLLRAAVVQEEASKQMCYHRALPDDHASAIFLYN